MPIATHRVVQKYSCDMPDYSTLLFNAILFFPIKENEKIRKLHQNHCETPPLYRRNAQVVWMILMIEWFQHSVKIGTLTALGVQCVMINCHIGTSKKAAYYFAGMIICNDLAKHANNVRLLSLGRSWLWANTSFIPNVFVAFVVDNILVTVIRTH